MDTSLVRRARNQSGFHVSRGERVWNLLAGGCMIATGLFAELKRRNVLRVGAFHAAAA